MKRMLKVLGILLVVLTAGAAAYYYFVMREKKPQVELYYEDGSMLSFPAGSPDAANFVSVAREVLDQSPVTAGF